MKTWTDTITNEDLWSITHQKSIEKSDKKKKIGLDWIGHTLGKETRAIEKSASDWNPQGCRRRGRPTRNW
jgi:hypothetical protein